VPDGAEDCHGTTGAASEGISLADRITAGVNCKRLIEYGRLEWVKSHGCHAAELVSYVLPSYSGENRLLLAKF
jgi:Methyltransferase TRM13